jgi:outer membrane protein OmpA-like peptidoglycan-associated protein
MRPTLALLLVLACDERPGDAETTMPVDTVSGLESPAREAEAPACPSTGDGVTVTGTAVETATPIGFDLYGPSLAPDTGPLLGAVARRLVACDTLAIEVRVHTDTRRTEAFNARQSQAIAELVKSRLVEAGVDAARLAACGYGESQPLPGVEPWDPSNDRVLFLRVAGAAASVACPSLP